MVLLGVTLTIVFLAEKLVSSVEHAAHTMGMTPVFVGVIPVAIVGNGRRKQHRQADGSQEQDGPVGQPGCSAPARRLRCSSRLSW